MALVLSGIGRLLGRVGVIWIALLFLDTSTQVGISI